MDMISKRRFCWLAAAPILIAGAGVAAAQAPQPTDAPHDVPDLGLSPEQKHTIYQGLTGPQAKNNAEPVGFRVAPGARVPDAIELAPVPKVVIDLVPKMADYQYAVVARQVIIVDPKSKTVVEAIAR
jgi:hypothetical protein